MFRSLRFRLPALFLLGIVLAGLVATLIAVRFFQSNTRAHAAAELRAESAGIVQLYERQAGVGHVSLANLNFALGGDRVFYVPVVPRASLQAGPLPELPSSAVPAAALQAGKPKAFDFNVDGTDYLGVAQPVS
ncbi:MAG TPA: hypothetical protein VLV46_06455, partial [Gaiellaceae bacterium]|nr:hypothetical protein [Gaiellaceae bacterium]